MPVSRPPSLHSLQAITGVYAAGFMDLFEQVSLFVVPATNPKPKIQNPTPYTLLPTPYTLHPTSYTLHPTPNTLHPHPAPSPYALRPTPYAPVGG